MAKALSRIALASLFAIAAPALLSAQRSSLFTRDNETFPNGRFVSPDCPDPQGGAQASTPDDTYGCWASIADSRPFNGSWLDVRIKPVFALVYVNGRYVGTAEQFTTPFRPMRIGLGPQRVEFRAPGYRTVSFWINTDTGKVTTATGTLIKNP